MDTESLDERIMHLSFEQNPNLISNNIVIKNQFKSRIEDLLRFIIFHSTFWARTSSKHR